MSKDGDIRAQALKDIEAHLAEFGPTNWGDLRQKYASVSEPTWWRWVKKAKESVAGQEAIADAKRKAAEKLPPVEKRKQTHEVEKYLPAAPPPHYIAKNGDVGMQTIDFLAEYHALRNDALLLREYSIRRDEDGTERIKIPAFFTKSADMRQSLLETAIKATKEVWDLKMMARFYDACLEEIAAESPEVAKRITERLARLNDEIGMTMSPAFN